MPFTHKSIDDAHLISLRGQIDNGNAASITSDILAIVAQVNPRLVLDFGEMSRISSAGLRAILGIADHVRRKGGRLGVCGLTPQVREMFELGGLSALMHIDPTPEAALARLV